MTPPTSAPYPRCGEELHLQRISDHNVMEYRADCRSCGWADLLHVEHFFELTSESWRCLDCGHVRRDPSPPREVSRQ